MVAGVDEQLQMASKLIVAGIVMASDGGVFDGSVHALDLTVGPGMIGLGQAMLDPVFCADAIEQMTGEPCCRPVAMARWMTELDAIVGQAPAFSRIAAKVGPVMPDLRADGPADRDTACSR